jgi:methyl-accepting chemotaxis protein-1 (serine sensor receptor)
MSKLNASDLIDLRRSLVSLASLMLLMVLTTGIAGLFAAWSLSEFHLRTENTLMEASAAVSDARSVQANFKVQVQEWKNILLRGHVEVDRARYRAAFRAQAGKTADSLKSLPAKVDRLQLLNDAGAPVKLADLVDVPGISTELAALNERYETALASASAEDAMDGWDPMLADGLLRGADRELSDRMESIPVALRKAIDASLRKSQQMGAERFETLSRFVWSAIVFALAMVAIMIWRILRHPALAR